MELLAIGLLVLAILVVTVLLGRQALRKDPGKSRGSPPGKGYHTLQSNYSSGLGGQSIDYKVPKDPQEYAKHFIPKEKTK